MASPIRTVDAPETGADATGADATGADATGADATGAVALGRSDRRRRFVAAAVVLALVTLGTVHGSDDDFPFGPLRMYASRDNPNGAVVQAVVQAVTRSGRVEDVTNTSGAPRRAELEGRMSEFIAHPARFDLVAVAFVAPGNITAADPEVRIRLVRRRFPLHDGRSGAPVDTIVSTWTVDR